MQATTGFVLKDGFPPNRRSDAVALFWSAFQDKLRPLMKPEEKALEFFTRVANPDYAISALDDNNELLGVAGFKTAKGSFIGGGLGDLSAVYGWFGGLWRGLLLSPLERPLQTGTLLMDGIFVAPDARGRGVGTALLNAIKNKAADLGCHNVRLDVIDKNARARSLYEREGFVEQETSDLGPLRHLFGFRRSTTMVYTLSPENHP